MSNLPIVSVLMTTYNREKYVAEAIETVLASSLTNFELIIVDDGSKDKTVEIAKQYAAKDLRIKVHINEKNLGDYPNRNQAASLAVGKYLKYVDADDAIYPWGLEILVNMMEANPSADWGLCSLEQNIEQPFPILLNPTKAYEYHYYGPGLFHKAPLSSIIKKKVFDEVNGFKPYRMVGDNEMWHRLSLNYNVLLMPHGMVWYREHNEQEWSSVKKYQRHYNLIIKHFLTHPKCPLSSEQRIEKLKFEKRQNEVSAIKSICKLKFSDAKKAFSDSKIFANTNHLPLPERIN